MNLDGRSLRISPDTIPLVPTQSAMKATFLANMTRLWRHDLRLAQRIDDLPPEASLDVQPSRAGPPTARTSGPGGRVVYLHSRHDPQAEADEFIRTLDAKDALCVVLSGMGLGHHILAIRRVMGPETLIIVFEPDLVTIKSALEHTELSDVLAAGRLEILASADVTALHERLTRHSTVLMLGTAFAVPPVSRTLNEAFHTRARSAVSDFAAFVKMSLITVVKNSAITCRNIANNLPTYVCTPPADLIRNRFQKCPAILVAAGPSLSRNIDQLKGVQDRAVIIAAQTTLRPLLARGIRPHFVTSLDYSDVSKQFFEGLDIPDDLVLVAEPKATWHAVDAFRGTPRMAGRRVILLDNTFAHRCLGEDLARRTPMPPGATVMHLAFYLAQWLGCDPIIFIGQDLGFSGHCYYSPGVAIHRAWRPELGRFGTLEAKEWERIARHRPILRKTVDADGHEIYTDEQMFTYLQQFERDFAQCPARIIDATEGGVRKAGTGSMPLKDTIEQHCRDRIAPAHFEWNRKDWFDGSRLQPARAILSQRCDDLSAFRSICEETLSIIGRLEGLVDQPDAFNRLIVRIDELRTMVQERGTIFQMVSSVSQQGELQKFTADRRLKADGLTGREHTVRQLHRDRHFVQALLAGCDEMASILDSAIVRFDAALKETA
jgi:hypothetical protein